ncbi:hypothetical protein HYFRA_00007805 [Hymenoscyphus fraxineus]|uniref:Uncharacterized protein n=1 Tax=Hymenoscyphus fraxineus TaxID=746836 RepID=A0A9N9KQ49_9HELO|nr:hypothetical protein HYFRA_00007805 [Hymenoscyphus fraxineus]
MKFSTFLASLLFGVAIVTALPAPKDALDLYGRDEATRREVAGGGPHGSTRREAGGGPHGGTRREAGGPHEATRRCNDRREAQGPHCSTRREAGGGPHGSTRRCNDRREAQGPHCMRVALCLYEMIGH